MRAACVLLLLSSCGPASHFVSDSGSAMIVDDTAVTADPPLTGLVLGEAPPDFTLVDSNPSSITYGEPVTVTDKTGFVTGWYFFKSS